MTFDLAWLVNFVQVFDQYLNFISLEEDFFVIRNQNTEELSYHGMWYVTHPTSS